MKLAHVSDLHFFQFPRPWGIMTKRLIGLVNLYIRGRRHHFSPAIAGQAIHSILAQAPDLVIISGDLTALASPREFEIARESLDPLLDRLPTVIVPGNHDYYTTGAVRFHRIEEYFPEYIRTPGAPPKNPTYPTLHLFGETAVIGLNPNHFSWAASGKLDKGEFTRLEEMLRSVEISQRFKVLAMHFPLFNLGGRITRKFWRRLRHPQKMLELVKAQRVDLFLHGHDHLRYANFQPFSPGEAAGTLLANAGSASYCRKGIPASYNLYRIENNRLVEVTYLSHDGAAFVPTFSGPPDRIPDLQH